MAKLSRSCFQFLFGDYMFYLIIDYFKPRKKQYYWRNRDNDTPVNFIEVAGELRGVKYALVEYEGVRSYVPYKELVLK